MRCIAALDNAPEARHALHCCVGHRTGSASCAALLRMTLRRKCVRRCIAAMNTAMAARNSLLCFEGASLVSGPRA